MHKFQFFAALIACTVPLVTFARDVTPEQNVVEYARQQYRQADAEHKADVEQLKRTRALLESTKKELARDENKARQSARKQQQAKQRLEQAQKALDRAWKQ